ncbi:hypothetical protein PhaeoP66_03238 [Phaeobacter inhibens]|uniref:Uncharacterized protein n=1 Tax=Phaeobacter inhibens TaxID=221822 RepID=A0ABN5GQW7_9RHOB|nr:hypothetical protein [Phaeobacter inhibens]AUQ95980.1 hypothetical protein PhaeoP66_03238 [Phaeobacter inhibens]
MEDNHIRHVELFGRQLDNPRPEIKHPFTTVSGAFLECDGRYCAYLGAKFDTGESAISEFHTVPGYPNMRQTLRFHLIKAGFACHGEKVTFNLPADS